MGAAVSTPMVEEEEEWEGHASYLGPRRSSIPSPPPTIALAHVATTPLVRDPHKRIRKYRSHTHTQYETVNGTNRSGQRVEEGWFGESKLLNWEQ